MRSRAARAPALVLSVVLATGCLSSPSGHERAERVLEQLGARRAAIVAVSDDVARTTEAIDVLSREGADPRPIFDRFVLALETTEEAADEAASSAKASEKAWRSFSRACERDTASIRSASVRERAEKRRAETSALFEAVGAAQKRADEVLEPYLSQVTDLRKYLENDVTPAGLESAQDLLRKAQQDGARVRERFQDLASRVDQARKAIAPVQPAPAKVR